MIYMDVKLEDWLKRYPALKVRQCKCDNCGAKVVTNRPFVTKDYAGLDSTPCPCGKQKDDLCTLVPRSISAIKRWMNLFS